MLLGLLRHVRSTGAGLLLVALVLAIFFALGGSGVRPLMVASVYFLG